MIVTNELRYVVYIIILLLFSERFGLTEADEKRKLQCFCTQNQLLNLIFRTIPYLFINYRQHQIQFKNLPEADFCHHKWKKDQRFSVPSLGASP